MSFTELEADPKTGRRRFRGHVSDGVHIGKSHKPKPTTIVIKVAASAPQRAAAPNPVTVRDSLEEKPKLTGPAEAYWPASDYRALIDGADIVVSELAPSGEEREIKRYPAARYGFEKVGENLVIRRRERSASDRAAVADRMRETRLATQAKLEGMNRRSRDRWADLRGQK